MRPATAARSPVATSGSRSAKRSRSAAIVVVTGTPTG